MKNSTDGPAGPYGKPGGAGRDALLRAVAYFAPVALGFIFLLEMRGSPFFSLTLSDDAAYLNIARLWDEGGGIGPVPFYFNPLYPMFLTVLRKFSVTGVMGIKAVQILLGSVSYLLVYLLAERFAGRRAAIFAWGLALFYGVMLQAQTELVSAWLEILLGLAAVWFLTGPITFGRAALAGLATGLLTLSRPYAGLFSLAAAGLLVFGHSGEKGEEGKGNARTAAVFLLAVFFTVLPVTLRNFLASGEFVPVGTNGGINFYIGNSPGAKGVFYAPPGFHEDLESTARDAVEIASMESGRKLGRGESSSFWMKKGLAWLAGNPGSALRLYAGKLLLLFHSYEVPSNSNYYVFREYSALLKILAAPFPLFLLLGSAGMWMTLKRRREGIFGALLVLVHLGAVLLLFVASRYRLPAVGLLAVFSGVALDGVQGRLAAWKDKKALGIAAVFCGAVLLLTYPYAHLRVLDEDYKAVSWDILGTYYYEKNLDRPEAEKLLRRAVSLRPGLKSSHWYLARILEEKGDLKGAALEWHAASELYGPDTKWGRAAAANRDRLTGKTR